MCAPDRPAGKAAASPQASPRAAAPWHERIASQPEKRMFAQINHTAIISHQYNALAKFYEAVFGLKYSAFRVTDAPIVSDGTVGMQLIPRRDGYVGGIDHFGMVVDDVETVLERMQKKHKRANIVKRPSTRPYAAYSGHDPDGNVFDLAAKKEDNRKDLYAEIAERGWHQ